jgi:hypothetical protein
LNTLSLHDALPISYGTWVWLTEEAPLMFAFRKQLGLIGRRCLR